MAATTLARQHIEEIRTVKFSIGGEPNPLTEDLHHAVRSLSAELYTKDVHFLMELIQNAEDNAYPAEVDPSLEFVITSQDITRTGALATLLVFNNEVGFSKRNIESICSVGRSTKKGRRREGFVGEKGIGFKSVFLVTSQPYIFSNGYQIKFTEEPSPDCDIGYIVPQWVDSNPTVTDIHKVYGLAKDLPMTTIVLPLKREKVEAVKKQLSSLHPEILLFLSKIKRASVRESNDDPQTADNVSSISITSERNFATRKDIDADSHIVFLSAEEDGSFDQCNYYMWRQRFPVMAESRVEVRKDVDEWVVSLAFPFGDRLRRGGSSAGVYAFLPTEMVTNFPFIIQADFLLTSSRETILLDNKWNKGILNCVSSAFVNALSSIAKSRGDAPISSIAHMFEFLPVRESPFAELNVVRQEIKTKILSECIMPCETFSEQVMFRKPCEVGRLLPVFWEILLKLKRQGVSLKGISSHGTYVLHSDADVSRFDEGLKFLGVHLVDYSWYANCIQGCGLAVQSEDDVYVDLLCFLADNWSRGFARGNMEDIPLLRYVNHLGKISLCSIGVAAKASTHKLRLAWVDGQHVWINKWNLEFKCFGGFYVLPHALISTLRKSRNDSLESWFKHYAGVEAITVYEFGYSIASNLVNVRDKNLVLSFSHFLSCSLLNDYISSAALPTICSHVPVIAKDGTVTMEKSAVLVPAPGSNWVRLMGSNPFDGRYIELSEDYFSAGFFAGDYMLKNKLKDFVEEHLKVSDLPALCPPDAELAVADSPLSVDKAFLLLNWIQHLRNTGVLKNNRFLKSIREGKWLKTSSGYCSPVQCFLSDNKGDPIFTKLSTFGLNLHAIDEEYYECKISSYKKELKAIGIKHGSKSACKIFAEHITSISSYELTKEVMISLLDFIRYLKANRYLTDDIILTLKEGVWLKTTQGYRTPVGSVFVPSASETLPYITKHPVVDDLYYGSKLKQYKEELKLLGVAVDLELVYPLIANTSASPNGLSKDCGILRLKCVRQMGSNTIFACSITSQNWLKTNLGYKCPAEAFLADPKWDCLYCITQVPVIDESFYGDVLSTFRSELKAVGVIVEFDETLRIIADMFLQLASSSSLTAANVLSLLASLKRLHGTQFSAEEKFKQLLFDEKWLATCHGYKPAHGSILYGDEWQPISAIADLPFIDAGYYGGFIYSYKDVLRMMGVVVDYSEAFQFVARGLKLPSVPNTINAASVLSLLECIRTRTMQSRTSDRYLPSDFLKKMQEVKWLKTRTGYYRPQDCLLFDSKWSSLLEVGDGPFIDELFYGSKISSYQTELKAMGVKVDVSEGCNVMGQTLLSHTDLEVIKRVYNFLKVFKWEPQDKSGAWIWIPNKSCTGGDWVCPESCVLSDKCKLFKSHLCVLDNYYDKSLLAFFSSSFEVRQTPSTDAYLKLWKEWEDDSEGKLEYSKCCSFWDYIIENWSTELEKMLSDSLKKLPAKCASGAGSGIQLQDKRDIFIPDDIQLKLIFERAYPDEPMFAWFPDPSIPSIPLSKLYEIYSSLGVKFISESVLKCQDPLKLHSELQSLSSRESPIKKGLIKLILGFLAKPSHGISYERRHKIAQTLIDLDVLETDDPITISYSLVVPSRSKSLNVSGTDMIRWEKNSQRLVIKRAGGPDRKGSLEFATLFAKTISKGVLWDSTNLIDDLFKLIRIGWILGFDMDALNYLLLSENLQLFVEDEEFLSAFPSTEKAS